MFRIDAADHVLNRFSEGNPLTGQPGTKLSAEWLNAVQEELCAILEAAGVQPDKAISSQIRSAIAVLSVANQFGPKQNFSNGAHFGGSPLTGVAMAASPANSDAANVAYVKSQGKRTARLSFTASGPVLDQGAAALSWVGSSPVYAVRVTWATPFAVTPVVAATLQIAYNTVQHTVEVRATSAAAVDLAIRTNAGDLQRLDLDGLPFNFLHLIALEV